MLEWLVKNLSQSKERFEVSHRFVAYGDSCYINSANAYFKSRSFRIYYQFAALNFRNLVITFEDVPIEFSVSQVKKCPKIVVIRDIRDLIASRLQAQKKHPNGFPIDDKFFNTWINHSFSESSGHCLIKFESWVSNSEYRDAISQQLGLNNLDDTSTVTSFGGGSSFSGTTKIPTFKELTQRRNSIVFPAEIQRIISSTRIQERLKALNYIDHSA